VPASGVEDIIRVPIDILTGTHDGPRLVLIAGVHGDEVEGILALRELGHELEPSAFRGQIVIVAIANPPAFFAGKRMSPLDGLDLNRSFPGNADGRSSERLAYHLLERLVLGADFLFSLHSWYAHGTVLPFVEVNAAPSVVSNRSLRAARAIGFRRIRLVDWPAGLLVRVANERGIAGLEAEIGSGGTSSAFNRAMYKTYIRRLMRHLGMRAGRAPFLPRPVLYKGIHILSPAAGVLRFTSRLGRRVRKGETIGRVEPLDDGNDIEVRVPAAGFVAAHRTYASVSTGDNVATIFIRISAR
jgi:N-alpha-acetyl-L-2,4-diaminobutyrate deacetylase